MLEFPCPHCGAPLNARSRAKVCTSCGKRIKQPGGPGKLIALGLAGLMLALVVVVLIQGPAP